MEEQKIEMKFFEGELPIKEGMASLTSYIRDLRKCLKSEEVLLTDDEIIKSLDIYLRILGIDRPINPDKGLGSLYSIFGIIEFNKFEDIDDERLEAVKTAIKNVNSLAEDDRKLSDETIENITEFYIPILLKEYAIFINELLLSILHYVSQHPHCEIMHLIYRTKDSASLMITGNFIKDIEDFAYTIVSNVISSHPQEPEDENNPYRPAIIINTFPEEAQTKLVKSLEEMGVVDTQDTDK